MRCSLITPQPTQIKKNEANSQGKLLQLQEQTTLNTAESAWFNTLQICRERGLSLKTKIFGINFFGKGWWEVKRRRENFGQSLTIIISLIK